MKTLLLGANGQVGRTFLEGGSLAKLGPLISATRHGGDAAATHSIEAVDLASTDSILALLDRVQPDVVINAAAYTAVDKAEHEEALAMQVNGHAVGVLGAWAATHKALVVHYSTDYVFDGKRTEPYPVDAATAPLGVYGRSKLMGEEALRASGADHMIFRTAWVYSAHGHNFLRTMLRLGKERDELRVVADQHGAPTPADLIVRATIAALGHWQQTAPSDRPSLQGTHHLVSSGATTWFGFATDIFDQAIARGLITHRPRLAAIQTIDFPTPAMRPEYSVLDNSGFQKLFGVALPDWREGLDNVMKTLSTLGS